MKRLVDAIILQDMKKYIKGFYPYECEPTMFGTTDPSVIEYVRNYYDNHLPVDLAAWIRVNTPDSKNVRDHLFEQFLFIYETLSKLLFSTVEEITENSPMVISTHVSYSVTLPVYRLNTEKYGVEIILKNDFNIWTVSVNSDIPLNFDVKGILYLDNFVPYSQCLGFPTEKIYGSYKENHSHFVCEFASNYDLYTFMFLLKRFLEKKKKII